jgi:hypothetical protein
MKTKLNTKEISILREKFIISYCKNMGWNHNELSTKQMLIITKQTNYINPTN